MDIFNLQDEKCIGTTQSVDTVSVVIHVENEDILSELQVNNLVAIRSVKQRQILIGMVDKIIRKFGELIENTDEIEKDDAVKVILVGTFLYRDGIKENVFKRTLESIPEINSECYILDGDNLSNFMNILSQNGRTGTNSLRLGTFALNKSAVAYLDGNRLFQKHAVIVGNTGSGKSCTVATLIEQIAPLKSSNAILFDIHGEYAPIVGENITHFKVAGPSDGAADNILFLPYWLLTYEEMTALLIDRSDNNAPNQAMIFSRTVFEKKSEYLAENSITDVDITIDSPIPYSISSLLDKLTEINNATKAGASGKQVKGAFNGTLSRFIQRLENKIKDRRLNFMFSDDDSLQQYNFMVDLCKKLMSAGSNGGGVKIIDFSEVPSDVLPLIIALIARLVFSVQQWIDKDKIHPLALFCDEAHLYIPQNVGKSVEESSLHSFERIAKEGRKYGIGLVVITQRPSEVDRTVLSQSSNFIAMRLTNFDDQNVIKRLLPDSLGNFGELLPILNVGEAIVVGDACLLPSRINISMPDPAPNSATIKFWDEWSKETAEDMIEVAVKSMRQQAKA